MNNLNRDSEPAGEQMTLFSQAGSLSHANHIHSQENDSEKRMNATCGRKCLESYRKLNRHGLWAKMFSDLLIGRTDWYSTRCRLTWKLKGTKYKRLYFQLHPSTHRTEGTGSGLLPTVVPESRGSRLEEGMAKRHSMELQDMAIRGLLPTPTAMDSSGATASMKSTQVKEGSMHSVTLSRALNMGLLPTPTVNDMKNATLPPSQSNRNDSIVKRILSEDSEIGKTSQLNPRFVLEMMGFPADWTELPFLNGEMSQSKHPETP